MCKACFLLLRIDACMHAHKHVWVGVVEYEINSGIYLLGLLVSIEFGKSVENIIFYDLNFIIIMVKLYQQH